MKLIGALENLLAGALLAALSGALVVSTTRITWPYFNRLGVRQTEAVEVRERF